MSDESQGMTTESAEGFSFNMAETKEDSGFAPIPAGVYSATVEEVEFRISQSSGAPMWSLKYALTEGEYAEKNRKLFGFVSFKQEQLGRAKQTVKRIAPELAELTTFNPKSIAESGVLIGRPVRLKVGIGTYNNEKRNEVKDVLAPATEGAGSFNM